MIIDGIPGGDMRALNQEDIESVDVLKDASAGAIYGTRAAGGVILVTTKQARQGRVTARIRANSRSRPSARPPTCSHQASTSSTDSARTTVTTPTGTRSLPTSFRFRSAIR
ncbi:MAG: TonB-dependent receptor plug domain-containing protein [Alistipes sp.]